MNWTQFRQEQKTRRRPLVIAHRGARLYEPENTLPSFALALAQGADVLETDLRFTSDGEIVLLHDSTLARTTDGKGAVSVLTLAALQKQRTRAPDGSLSEAHVPTLAELIQATAAQIPLLLELKDPRFSEPSGAQRLVTLLERHDMVQRTAIVSFHPEYVATVAAVCPEIPTGNITYRNPLPLGKAELLGPVWPFLYLNPLYVAWAHRLGKIVCPLDPRPEPRIGYYLRLRVDALLTDNPASTLTAIGEQRR